MSAALKGLTLRNLTSAEELALPLDWAAREGWNPGLADGPAFFAADAQGFFLASLDGRPVGSASAVLYSQDYAFGGLFMVEPDLRGRGIGRALVEVAMARVGNRIAGLDGVVAQQDNYRAMGFELAFKSARYQAQGGGADPGGVVDLAERWEQVLAQVIALDALCFPAPREAFLRQWLRYPGGAALGVVQDPELTAYGLLRPCRVGHKIVPLFATNPAAAERLFQAFLHRAGSGPVFIDTPQNNPEAVALVKRHGLEPVFECGRMYMNGQPPWQPRLVYGLTTFELG